MPRKQRTVKSPPKSELVDPSISFETDLFNNKRLDTLFGRQTKRFGVIARDPIVKSALNLVESGVFWTHPTINPNQNNDYESNPEFSDLDDQIINTLKKQLNNIGRYGENPPNVKISPNFIEILKGILSDSRTYGFSITELVWDQIEGENVLTKLKPKPPWNFDININNTDEIESLQHSIGLLDKERFLIGTWPFLNHGNYYGISDMQSIEQDVELKNILAENLAKGGASSAYRTLIAYISMKLGKDDQTKIKSVINQMKSGSLIQLPKVKNAHTESEDNAVSFETLEDRASQYALENIWNIVLEIIKIINRALGVPDDLGSVSSGEGSFARAKVQFDLFTSTVERARQYVQQLAQQVIDTICYYNFQNISPDYHPPVWSFGTIEEDADKTKADMIDVLVKAGVIQGNEPWIREMFDFPPLDPELEEEEPEVEEESEEDIKEDDLEEDQDSIASKTLKFLNKLVVKTRSL